MPVVPSTAYTTVEGVLNLSRALINDMLVNTSGEILTDNAPFTFPLLNMAADYFEREMANNGVHTFIKETILTPITPIDFPNLGPGVSDPGQQVNISDTGYFNGSTNSYPPQLPTDMITPINLWERQTGSTETWLWMVGYPDGLPSLVQSARLCAWEWRTERIYMPGAVQSEDIRLRYEGETAHFSSPNDTILIRGAQSAIANYLAAVFVNTRNPMAAGNFAAAGDDFTRKIVISNVRASQRQTVTRQSYGAGYRVGR